MKRLILVLLTVLVGSLPPAASAEKPIREFFPASDTVLEGICAFPVEEQVLVNKEYTITFADGRQLVTGVLKVRLTNVDDPSKSLDLNISGPGVITPTEGGGFVLKASGTWLLFFAPGDLGPDEPGQLLLVTGLSILEVDAEGNLSFTQKAGTDTDLCAALA